MYEVFYNLKAEPFRLSPDHKFCYEHKGYAKARAYMAYAFKRAEGFVMITGRPGTGKTTLIGELVESLANDNVRTANLVCTQLQADDLLKTVAFNFGVGQGDFDKAQLLQRLTTLFQRWHQEGGRALLIVDEAQDLSPSAMEELRLLTNIQIGGQPLVQIFLLGQPELRDLVMAPEMEQVHQRVIAASHLRGLEVEETEAYVAHRLHAVGWKGDPAIDRAIFPLIHKFSEGVPRRINLICSRLFLLCSVEQRHEVVVADVKDVIGELQAENLAAGSWFSEADFDLTREPEWLPVPGQAPPELEPDDGDPDDGNGNGDESGSSGTGDGGAKDTTAKDTTADGSGADPGDGAHGSAGDEDGEQLAVEASADDEADERVVEGAQTAQSGAEAAQSEPTDRAEVADASCAVESDSAAGVSADAIDVEASETTADVEAELSDAKAQSVDAPVTGNVADTDPDVDQGDDQFAQSSEQQGQQADYEQPDATVEVVEELFEVVTAQEYVDLPPDTVTDGLTGDSSDFERVGHDGSHYFSGTVVAESALGSEEAVSELANLPEDFIADGARDAAESDDEEDMPPVKKLDEVQRDGKAWPTSSRPASVTTEPSARTHRAIGVLALVAMVGAGVFFLELYLTRQDQGTGGGSLLERLSLRGPAQEQSATSNTALQAEPQSAQGAGSQRVSDTQTKDAAAPVMQGDSTKPSARVSPPGGSGLEGDAPEAEVASGGASEGTSSLDESVDQREGGTKATGAASAQQTDSETPSQPVLKQVYVVNFDFDSSDIGQDANAVLSKALEKLQQYPASTATIARNAQGQTPGTAAATMSEARAGAVARYFLSEGVEPTRINIERVSDETLASSVAGLNASRAIQVIVSRSLET